MTTLMHAGGEIKGVHNERQTQNNIVSRDHDATYSNSLSKLVGVQTSRPGTNE